MIELSPQDVVELKKLSSQHKKGDSFEYKGHEFLKEYADYLIQYLEEKYEP